MSVVLLLSSTLLKHKTPRIVAILGVLVIVPTAQAQPSTELTDRGVIFASPNEPRILRFLGDDGATYEILGTRGADGLPDALTGVRVFPTDGPTATVHFDERSRPSMIEVEGAGWVLYSWVADTVAHITVFNPAGTLIAEDYYNFTTGASEGVETGTRVYHQSATAIRSPVAADAREFAPLKPIVVRIDDCVAGQFRDDALYVEVQVNSARGLLRYEAKRIGPGVYSADIWGVNEASAPTRDLICPRINQLLDLGCQIATTGPLLGPVVFVIGESSVIGELLVAGGEAGKAIYEVVGGHRLHALTGPCGAIKLQALTCEGCMERLCEFAFDETDPLKGISTKARAVATLPTCWGVEKYASADLTIDVSNSSPVELRIAGCGDAPAPKWTAMITLPDGRVLAGDQMSETFFDAMAFMGSQESIHDGVTTCTRLRTTWVEDDLEAWLFREEDPIKTLRFRSEGMYSAEIRPRGGTLVVNQRMQGVAEDGRAPKPSEQLNLDAEMRAWKEWKHSASTVTLMVTHELSVHPGQTLHISLTEAGAIALGRGSEITGTISVMGGISLKSDSFLIDSTGKNDRIAELRVSHAELAQTLGTYRAARSLNPGVPSVEMLQAYMGKAQMDALRDKVRAIALSGAGDASRGADANEPDTGSQRDHCIPVRLMVSLRATVGSTGGTFGHVIGGLNWRIDSE